MFKKILCLAVVSLFICFGYVSESYSANFTISNVQTFEFPGASWTIGRDINNSGEIVGDYIDGSGINGFTYDGVSNFSTFNSNFSQWTSTAHGINDSGEIVGQWRDANNLHGYSSDGVNFTSYDYPGSSATYFRDINNNSEIVGGYWDANGVDHSLLYDGTSFSSIDPIFTDPTLTYSNSIAHGINDSSQIVGNYWDTSIANSQRGYFYNGTDYESIYVSGSLQTHAYGINNSGLIVGDFSNAGFGNGFIFDGTDYSTIMVSGSVNTTIWGINDVGQIVGSYDDGNSNNPKGFVATVAIQPVPEPATIALLGIGIVGLAGAELRRRRKKKIVDKS